jgi:hypothetical protein
MNLASHSKQDYKKLSRLYIWEVSKIIFFLFILLPLFMYFDLKYRNPLLYIAYFFAAYFAFKFSYHGLKKVHDLKQYMKLMKLLISLPEQFTVYYQPTQAKGLDFVVLGKKIYGINLCPITGYVSGKETEDRLFYARKKTGRKYAFKNPVRDLRQSCKELGLKFKSKDQNQAAIEGILVFPNGAELDIKCPKMMLTKLEDILSLIEERDKDAKGDFNEIKVYFEKGEVF